MIDFQDNFGLDRSCRFSLVGHWDGAPQCRRGSKSNQRTDTLELVSCSSYSKTQPRRKIIIIEKIYNNHVAHNSITHTRYEYRNEKISIIWLMYCKLNNVYRILIESESCRVRVVSRVVYYFWYYRLILFIVGGLGFLLLVFFYAFINEKFVQTRKKMLVKPTSIEKPKYYKFVLGFNHP